MRSALALLAAAVVLAPQPAGAAQAPPATIVAEAEGLYRRVNAQIAKTPKQQREADAADAPPNGPSWTFQRALGHFSDHVRAAASAHEIDDSTHEVPEMTNWLAAAMKSSADMCNAAHARLYLHVARTRRNSKPPRPATRTAAVRHGLSRRTAEPLTS